MVKSRHTFLQRGSKLEKKAIPGILLAFLLVSMFTLAFYVQPVESIGTVSIRADGSIDPPTAPIQRNGDRYVLTGDVVSDTNGIVIERNNVILDGASHVVQGSGSGDGIVLGSNVTIKNLAIRGFDSGFSNIVQSNNHIIGNNITNNVYGIRFYNWSIGNSIIGNNIMNNVYGVGFFHDPPQGNIFYHNNFINNTEQVVAFTGASKTDAWSNIWDNGYPSGGNYWSDYIGIDSDGDGLGDTPYIIDVNNQDNFPLTDPKSFNTQQPPFFSIVEAMRTYYLKETTNETGYGYNYSVKVKNIGGYAASVAVSDFPDFLENGRDTGYGYSIDTDEIRTFGFGYGWGNQTKVPQNKWVKLVITATQTQTFYIYFNTTLTVSCVPSELEYPRQVTISGKLTNGTDDVGIPNQALRFYVNESRKADLQTGADGSYSTVLVPPYGINRIFVVWGSGEGAVANTTLVVRTPTVLSLSLSSSTTYIGFRVGLSGKLTYTNGSGISDTTISLQCGNDRASAYTLADGSYSAQWIPTVTGVFAVSAEWDSRWDKGRWILGAKATVNLAVSPLGNQYVFSVFSNSTLSALAFDPTNRELSFTVSGPSDTMGYANLTIARPLIGSTADIEVRMNGTDTNYVITSNNDSYFLYFTYHHSTSNVKIDLGPLDIVPPILANLMVQPEKPTPDDAITITISVTENKSGIKEVNLYYSIDSGSTWSKIQMSLIEGSTYAATVSKQKDDTTLLYYVEALDNSNNKAASTTHSLLVKAAASAILVIEPQILLAAILGCLVGAAIASIYFINSRRKRQSISAKTH